MTTISIFTKTIQNMAPIDLSKLNSVELKALAYDIRKEIEAQTKNLSLVEEVIKTQSASLPVTQLPG